MKLGKFAFIFPEIVSANTVHCMVRFPVPTANHIFSPKPSNCNSDLLSKARQCLSFLKLCCSKKHLYQIHAQIQVSGLQNDAQILKELVRFCTLSSSKNLTYARSILCNYVNDSVPIPWNNLIRGYAWSDRPREAVWVFIDMKRRGIKPTEFTHPFVLKACAEISGLNEGMQVQANVTKSGLDSDVYTNNNLVRFYGSCRRKRDACKVFDDMCERSVVSWNVIITVCVENLWLGEAVGYFVKMKDLGFEPDETTMLVVLSACTELGNLSLGKWVHLQLIERGTVLNCQLGTALIDMYAKCGAVGCARLLFSRMEEINVWTWSAMILGLAQHRYAEEALELFSNMKNSSISPNYVTFLGVLCACNHAGMVEDGYRYFHEMEHVHGIKPMRIHYHTMADILARAGHLKEAYSFIMNMPFQPNPIVLRALLSASSIHDAKYQDGVGNEVRRRLLELEPRGSQNLVIVANKYAEVGMWEKVSNVRRFMKNVGLKKMKGMSWVELGGSIHRFYSGYDSQVELAGIYQILETLNLHMKVLNF